MATLDLLQDYKGYTFKEKIVTDCQKILIENKSKSLGYLPRPSETSLVTVLDKNKEEILGLGGSKPNDLLLEQFNTLIELYNRSNNLAVVMKLTNGLTANIKAIGTINNWYSFSLNRSAGTRIGVGAGITPPARSDFQIETPFGSAPESGFTNTTDGGYNSGLGQVSASSTIGATGGAGTINESALLGFWVDTANIARALALARDAISPAPSFIAGNFINVNYVWQL